MNVNPLILEALAPLSIPCSWLEYKGNSVEYITFQDELNAPTVYADDTDSLYRVVTQIHYFCKHDPHETAKKIRNALRNAGFVLLDTFIQREAPANTKDSIPWIHTIIRVETVGENDDTKEDILNG